MGTRDNTVNGQWSRQVRLLFRQANRAFDAVCCSPQRVVQPFVNRFAISCHSNIDVSAETAQIREVLSSLSDLFKTASDAHFDNVIVYKPAIFNLLKSETFRSIYAAGFSTCTWRAHFQHGEWNVLKSAGLQILFFGLFPIFHIELSGKKLNMTRDIKVTDHMVKFR